MYDRLVLFPYYLTLKVRNAMFDLGLRKQHSAEVPTICVGNVTVGGTGKTPHTEMILRMLLAHEDWAYRNIAVLSRGYKRESRGFQQVVTTGKASFYGDEPLQIKKKFPAVTVALESNRIRGCDYLCHPDKVRTLRRTRRCVDKNIPAADVIVLDDAYQYRQLKASLNIVLVDFERPVFSDRLLPIGSLRDLPERIYDADVIIVTKCDRYITDWDKTVWATSLGIRDYDSKTCEGTGHDGRRQKLFFTTIEYSQPAPIYGECDPRYIYARNAILFTGIAKDTPLRRYLSDNYRLVEKFKFKDHHKFSKGDVRAIHSAAMRNSTAAIITTEKDAHRIMDFDKLPFMLKERMFKVPIEVNFVNEREREVFSQTLFNTISK